MLIQLRQIFTNLKNEIERSGVGADLEHKANTKGSIDPISLVNARVLLATPRRKNMMYQRIIWERRGTSMNLWKKYRVVMNRAYGYGVESLMCGWQQYC